MLFKCCETALGTRPRDVEGHCLGNAGIVKQNVLCHVVCCDTWCVVSSGVLCHVVLFEDMKTSTTSF